MYTESLPSTLGGKPLQNNLSRWLHGWPWEFRGTFTMPSDFLSNETFAKRLNRWATRFQKTSGLQIGFIGVIAWGDCRKHAHILGIGENRHGTTFQRRFYFSLRTMMKHGRELPYYRLHPDYRLFWKGDYLIQPCTDVEEAAAYVGKHCGNPDHFEVIQYNTKLLQKTRLF